MNCTWTLQDYPIEKKGVHYGKIVECIIEIVLIKANGCDRWSHWSVVKVNCTWRNITPDDMLQLFIYYRPQTKLQKGNVFTPACNSVHSGYVSQHAMGKEVSVSVSGVYTSLGRHPLDRHPLLTDIPPLEHTHP